MLFKASDDGTMTHTAALKGTVAMATLKYRQCTPNTHQLLMITVMYVEMVKQFYGK